MLDEATARATAIHDGAERRLNLLMSRHTETIRRLTEVRDVVTNLVAGEAARGSLEEEVARSVASAGRRRQGAGGRPAGTLAEGRPGPGRAGPAPVGSRRAPARPATGAAPPGPRHRSPAERVPGRQPRPPSRGRPAEPGRARPRAPACQRQHRGRSRPAAGPSRSGPAAR